MVSKSVQVLLNGKDAMVLTVIVQKSRALLYGMSLNLPILGSTEHELSIIESTWPAKKTKKP